MFDPDLTGDRLEDKPTKKATMTGVYKDLAIK